MMEPLDFFERATPMPFECASCGLFRVVSFDANIQAAEVHAIKRRVLSAMQWLQLPRNELACFDCSEMLRERLIYLPRSEALPVQQALAEQLFHSRIAVEVRR